MHNESRHSMPDNKQNKKEKRSGPDGKYAAKGENVTRMQCGANKRRKKKGDKRKIPPYP